MNEIYDRQLKVTYFSEAVNDEESERLSRTLGFVQNLMGDKHFQDPKLEEFLN